MNILLIEPEAVAFSDTARITGRAFQHAVQVLGAAPGKRLKVGVLGGQLGTGLVTDLGKDHLDLACDLHTPPPPKLPLTLLVALPRPKVLNRLVASATSLGVARLVLLNAWRVEKSYWRSPRLEPENLRAQMLLGLEQAGDTVLPELRLARLFLPFVERELPALAAGSRRLLAHPGAGAECPRQVEGPATLALGPEGGWIDAELASFARAGFEPVALGPRVLRTETAVAALVGRLA